MLNRMQHHTGVPAEAEILFDTRFGYLFPAAARSRAYLVADADPAETRAALEALGDAMSDPGTPTAPADIFDSEIPAVFTYLGQFIDHDITARTDRNTETSDITDSPERRNPDDVVRELRNGRRPQLDLDSVYADGPGLVPGSTSDAQVFGLYRGNLSLEVQRDGHRVDLPRHGSGAEAGRAIIADERNDENVIISQLHAAFLAFHNSVMARQSGTAAERYVRARQLVRWAYQFIVINEYLPAVCHPDVVDDVLANGPRFIGDTAGQGGTFMPLEFSVAAFRFGHTMVRPFYVLNGVDGGVERSIDEIFFPGRTPGVFLDGGFLRPEFRVAWERFIPEGTDVQFARRLDPRLSQGLFNLSFETDALLKKLGARNLLRGYSLSIPTGQGAAKALGFRALAEEQLIPSGASTEAFRQALLRNDLMAKTPLWYYVLQEASVQTGGTRLGEVGSRIVAETLVSLIKNDPNSYLNNRHDEAVRADCIDVLPGLGGRVDRLADLLRIAGVL